MISPIIPVMSGKEALWFFVLYGYAVVASYGDAYYTAQGKTVGDVELNPVARWLQDKLGAALAFFVAIVGFTVLAGILIAYKPVAAFIYVAVVAGIETFNTIRNRILYKQGLAAIAAQPKPIAKK